MKCSICGRHLPEEWEYDICENCMRMESLDEDDLDEIV